MPLPEIIAVRESGVTEKRVGKLRAVASVLWPDFPDWDDH